MAFDHHSPLPPLRSNLEIRMDVHEGTEVIILHDEEGIAESNIMLEAQLLLILEKLDGSRSLSSLHAELVTGADGDGMVLELGQLASFVSALDEACLLESDRYFETRLFLESDVCASVCDGICYPKEPQKLHAFLDEILQSSPRRSYPSDARAILAPHIDFRVDRQVYAAPFNAIRDSEFELVVHIGTSHYGWQDQFLLTRKDFVTPLGTVTTDRALVDRLYDTCEVPLTRNDVAYAPEHALEFHHVFLQHLFPDRRFTVLPVLVTSFGDHVQEQKDPMKDRRVRSFIEALQSVVRESGRRTLWVVSGDLAHVGRRFGDAWDAESMLDTLRAEDQETMDSIIKGSPRDVFDGIARNGDRRRVCGLPPVWTMLQALGPTSGTALGYGQWNDSPTGTAVTYGAAAWW